MDIKEQIDRQKLPLHIAVIMDGNGRWAQRQGKERIFGHEQGVKAVRETTEAAAELGIRYLTLYAFSTENWKRPKEEVSALMHLLVQTIGQETKTLMKNNIRLQAIGDLKSLDAKCHSELMEAIRTTSENTRMTLILALSYSSRWEIVEAARRIAEKASLHQLDYQTVDDDVLIQHLTTARIPDPELLIRTSGEFRLSNFLLWQIAYTELYFTPKLWPDFNRDDLYEAILDFQKRDRRFGKV
ncbi:MAG: isoprenyl transferase [Bacteroidales bacterium]|nr:isoprenyl transferase [Lentimicrobiaceae bacterium]MDD5693685.1 isoprenyl transferase [Bacteroidales bacterium]